MDAFLVFTVILLWGIPVSIIIENSNSKAKYITVVTVLSLALSNGLFGLKEYNVYRYMGYMHNPYSYSTIQNNIRII